MRKKREKQSLKIHLIISLLWMMYRDILIRCIITPKHYVYRTPQSMNGIIKFLSSDRTIWFSILISLSLLFISLVLTALFYRNLPPLLPLFNQLPWGTDRLFTKLGFFIPTIVTTGIILINAFVTRYIYEKMPIAARMLNVTGLLISLLTLFFVFRTIQLIL